MTTPKFSVWVVKATRKPFALADGLHLDMHQAFDFAEVMYKHIKQLSANGYAASGISIQIVNDIFYEKCCEVELGGFDIHSIDVSLQMGPF